MVEGGGIRGQGRRGLQALEIQMGIEYGSGNKGDVFSINLLMMYGYLKTSIISDRQLDSEP